MENHVLECIMNRSSVRNYTDQQPEDNIIETVVRAGQQAPFAAQLYTVLLNRDREKKPFGAPLLFTFCVDFYKFELIMARRGWKMVSNNISALIMGIQDVAYAAENMVLAAESLGLGSCFLGMTPYKAKNIQKEYNLPQRVFPLIELVMGYPVEKLPPRPRYPLEFAYFEDHYPEINEEMVSEAMNFIDAGYLSQGYYSKNSTKIEIEIEGKKDSYTFDNYSWTEHNSRRWGQKNADPSVILDQLKACGFPIEVQKK